MSEQKGAYVHGHLPGLKELFRTPSYAEEALEHGLEREREELEQKAKSLPDPRPEVQWFSRRMELKLRANDHKPHWSGMHTDYLIHRLFQEADELWMALQYGESAENIVQEAADVANFAMMIADVVGMRREAEGR